MDEFLWVEKYRPKTVTDCILPPRIKQVFQEYVNKKSIPNLMLTGTAGVGKTTAAKAMCEEIGLSYMYVNASKERGIDTLRTKVESFATTMSLMGGRKVIIMDEADNLTPDAQMALRGIIEAVSSNCTFIFTCNFKSRIIDAIHSRCATVDFTLQSEERPKMAGQFFKRVQSILDEEKIHYDKNVLVKIVERHFPDFRRVLNELQRYASVGAIDAGVLDQLNDIRKLSELVSALKNRDFGSMRKWVVNNSDIDPAKIFRRIYEGLYDVMKPQSIPQAVVTIAKYQYQAAFVADQEINLVACLTELMVECEYV